MIKVLVVDDSALVRKLFGQILTPAAGFETVFARDGLEALDALATFAPDVITLDVQMPRMDGLACLDRIMVEHPCPVVMVSSLTAAGATATLEALRLGAVDFMAKPKGAVSLHLDEVGAELVAKVRVASGAKLRSSLRLKDRIRHRMGIAVRPHAGRSTRGAIAQHRSGEGLVLVGTSTGGPPALEALLQPLPADFGWPVIVAQHMPATFTGPLAERLNGLCALTVSEVSAPTTLRPGHVYIGRGEADVVVLRRGTDLVVMTAPSRKDYPWHPSADRLVRSAMEHVIPAQLVGVLMTGMGNDGAEAMALMHREGGRTIAEAEETAVVWGMPGELVKSGGADWVEPLPDIAARLMTLVA